MILKALHLLLMLSTLTFGFAEAIEAPPIAASSDCVVRVMNEEHQHHENDSHLDGEGSHCSQCCHLSLNALPRLNDSPNIQLSRQVGVSNYRRQLVTHPPTLPYRPPIS